ITNKWYISPQVYPPVMYPPFINGIYMIPGVFTTTLYEAIVVEPRNSTIPALPFEDVYVTGLLATKADLPRVHSTSILYNQHFFSLMLFAITNYWSSYSIILDQLNSDAIRKYWTEYGAN